MVEDVGARRTILAAAFAAFALVGCSGNGLPDSDAADNTSSTSTTAATGGSTPTVPGTIDLTPRPPAPDINQNLTGAWTALVGSHIEFVDGELVSTPTAAPFTEPVQIRLDERCDTGPCDLAVTIGDQPERIAEPAGDAWTWTSTREDPCPTGDGTVEVTVEIVVVPTDFATPGSEPAATVNVNVAEGRSYPDGCAADDRAESATATVLNAQRADGGTSP